MRKLGSRGEKSRGKGDKKNAFKKWFISFWPKMWISKRKRLSDEDVYTLHFCTGERK